MAQYPVFPLWTDAYLGDTNHLTTTEHGAYLLLLVTMWRAMGTLPNDDRQLAKFARLTTTQWQRIKPTIMPFFQALPDGTITQGRLTDELGAVRRHSKKQSENARARWLKNNDSSDAEALPNACQTDAPLALALGSTEEPTGSLSETSSDEPKKAGKKKAYTADFEAFWSEYPRTPNMGKAEAYNEWRKLDADDRAAARAALPAFKAFLNSKPDLSTQHACRFLSKRRFEGFAEQAVSTVDDAQWVSRLEYGRSKKQWSVAGWGPAPGAPGCGVPAKLLVPSDGADWKELRTDQ